MEASILVNYPDEPAQGSWYTDEEIAAAVESMNDYVGWNKEFTSVERELFEKEFASYIGAKYAISVNSAATGLDLSMMVLNLKPGDEVISCSINFPGTHLAIIGQGARLVLCEPAENSLNIDPGDLARKLTPATRAVLVTHMNGMSADMDTIRHIVDGCAQGISPPKIVYDCARTCGATYKGRVVGSDGWLNVFSFQNKKQICTLGEGGMIVTDDSEAAERLRDLRSFGRGKSWGSNFRLSKVQSAVGRVQLRRLDSMNSYRRKNAASLLEYLSPLTGEGMVLPFDDENIVNTYTYFSILLPSRWAGEGRDYFQELLKNGYGVGSCVANPPTYMKNTLIREQTKGQETERADSIGARLVCPSFHPLMTAEDVVYIADAIHTAFKETQRRYQ